VARCGSQGRSVSDLPSGYVRLRKGEFLYCQYAGLSQTVLLKVCVYDPMICKCSEDEARRHVQEARSGGDA